jgi:hypothetical protein
VGTFTAAGPPAAILDPVLGRTAVVARGTDNEVYRVFETAPGSGVWGTWSRLNPEVSDPAATDPTVTPIINSSGQTWLVVFRNANDATRAYERDVPTATLRANKTTGEWSFRSHTLPTAPTDS